RERADDHGGHADPVAERVDSGREDVVVEAAPVIPGQEDRGGVPDGGVPHHRVDDLGDICHSGADQGGRVLAVRLVGRDPGHGGQGAAVDVAEEGAQGLDVADLMVLLDVDEPGQRVPDDRNAAGTGRLRASVKVVAPAHAVLVQQPGQVGPAV